MKRIILIYSIDDIQKYCLFTHENEIENWINDQNEYENDFKIIDCYYIGEKINIEPIEIVTKYLII